MDIINRRPGLTALVAFVAGLIIGLVVLGWGLFPVQYEGADPSGLFPQYREAFVRNAADLYSFDNNQEKLRASLGGWGGDTYACDMAQNSLDPAEQQRLIAAATLINGTGCAGSGAPILGGAGTGLPNQTVTAEEEENNLLPLLLLGLLSLLLLAAILYVYNRRRSLIGDQDGEELEYGIGSTGEKAATGPYAGVTSRPPAYGAPAPPAGPEPVAVPIARFRTQYTRGHDTYDDQFSIENASNEFLGECGVGISEAIGATTPKSVTALEVWLFDKNDIRTITKVIMSDHAFFDEAIKAKLAPKGEPVLAREKETIVLETATLIVNAEITELDYGSSGDMPDASYFERFTIEMSAWVKEGDDGFAPVSDAEDLLNY